MTKNMIDDKVIAKPPYTGPKEDEIEDKELSDKQVKAMLVKLFPVEEEVEQVEELEESVALALQNYRDGLIDADDLVAFLLPTRLDWLGNRGIER